jgi:hypothetical protein
MNTLTAAPSIPDPTFLADLLATVEDLDHQANTDRAGVDGRARLMAATTAACQSQGIPTNPEQVGQAVDRCLGRAPVEKLSPALIEDFPPITPSTKGMALNKQAMEYRYGWNRPATPIERTARRKRLE